NATKESDYEDTHPLGRESHYWSAWGSYIFSMTNAKIDTDGDGQHDDASILYHTGSDEAYRTAILNTQVAVLKDEQTRVVLSIDLAEILKTASGEPIDLLANPNTHDISNLTLANQLMDNFAASLEVAK
ncbi:MAG: hypothetical protein KDC44_24160, partial [Phaeodactylibacter sp.]|nr:hypothetical protein [Phaeodactylibacter sp.]